MAEIRVTAEGKIGAPAAQVYGILADYRQHHPKILPPSFSNYQVEEGGVGEGTVIRYTITAGGRSRTARARITEPEPGRVLRESELDTSAVTTFTVSPDTAGSTVQIETTWQSAGGIGGFFERLFAPRVLRKLYEDELARLDEYARQQADQP